MTELLTGSKPDKALPKLSNAEKYAMQQAMDLGIYCLGEYFKPTTGITMWFTQSLASCASIPAHYLIRTFGNQCVSEGEYSERTESEVRCYWKPLKNRRWTLKGIYDSPSRSLEPHIIDSPLYSSVSVSRASHRPI